MSSTIICCIENVHTSISTHQNSFNKSISRCKKSLLFFYDAIGTAVTPGLLCQPRVIVKMIVEKQMQCRLAGETEVLGENLPHRHFCPSHNPTWRDPGLNPGRRGGESTLLIFIKPNTKFSNFIVTRGSTNSVDLSGCWIRTSVSYSSDRWARNEGATWPVRASLNIETLQTFF
jgi:hypothetical protein